MSDTVSKWLELSDCGKYAKAFAENDVDAEVLLDLTDSDLEKLGVTLGHRKKLLRAIEVLRVAQSNEGHQTNTPVTQSPRRAASETGAERRQLTVMFCDLVGSTALAGELDLEDYRELLSSYQATVAKSIALFDGYIARYMGDGLLIYFGYPQAHEDDAERAIRAALSVVAAIEDLNRRQGSALEVRIGIATGQVVAGDIVGEGASEERAVLGDTPSLAARLQSIASPGSVLISTNTRRLTRGLFAYEDTGHHPFKGFARPVQAWRVIAEVSSESRFVATRRPEATPLTGRDTELLLLLDRWKRIKDFEGQAVLLAGEPGIGKSRLVHAFRARVAGDRHTVMAFQCSPYHVNSAFYPIVEHIRRASGIVLHDAPERKLDKLETWLDAVDEPNSAAAPLIAALLSIESPDRYGPVALTPQQRKEASIRALTDRITRPAQQAPLLIVVEDIHWADPTTLDLLRSVIDTAPRMAMLIIMTHRPEFTPPWQGRGHVTTHSLTRLGKRQVTRIVVALAGKQRLPDALLGEIVEKTDGVPLFVEELTKTVLEGGLREATGDGRSDRGPRLSVPSTLQDSLVARLDRLGQAKGIAQIASVIGREFPLELLSKLSPIGENALADTLVMLEQSELIYRRGTGPETIYLFKHALLQDAAYASLLKSRRVELHAQIAEVLESRFPHRASEEPELLAYHCTAAGLTTKAVSYWRNAAEHALQRSAYQERLAHLDSALQLVERNPDLKQRRAWELELQILRGGTLMAARGFRAAETGEAFARARTLAAELDEPRQAFAALRGLHGVYFVRADLDAALEVAVSCLDIAETDADREHQALAHRLVGQTRFIQGDLEEGRKHLQEALKLDTDWRPERVAALITGGGHRLMVPTFLAQVLWLQGFPDQALDLARNALEQAEQHYGAFDVAANMFFLSWIHGWRGEFRALRKLTGQLQTLSTEHDISEWIAPGTLLADWSLLASGNTEEATALALQQLATVRTLGGVMTPFKLGLLAEALAPSEAEKALAVIDEALNLSERGERWSHAELLRIKGDILAGSGDDPTAAEQYFKNSLHTAHEQGARSWELRSATALARLWSKQDRCRQARDLLAPIFALFSEGFETVDLRDASAVLKSLS